LCPKDREPKLSAKLKDWWRLDFGEFRAEIKKRFKADIPVAERNDWERYLETERGKVEKLSREIAELETEIDRRVYRLFELTGDEIELLEASLEGQV